MDPDLIAAMFGAGPNNPGIGGGLSGGFTPGDPYNNPTPTIFPWIGDTGTQAPSLPQPSGLPAGPSGGPLAPPTQVNQPPGPPTDLTAPNQGSQAAVGGESPYPTMEPLPGRGSTGGGPEKGGDAAGKSADRILASLRGLQAPKPPEVQRVATPHPMPVKPIQGGSLVNLLSSLGIGPRDVYQVPHIQLPNIGR